MKAVVTGGTKGIGLAISNILAKEGYDIILCSRNLDEGKHVAHHLEYTYGIKAYAYVVDMSKSEEVVQFGNEIIKTYGFVDVLVNNAGVFIPGSILEEAEGNFELMLDTNLRSAYHLTRILAPKMVERSEGHIFNICSIASKIAYPNGGSYAISKFGMYGFNKVLREELKDKNVKVTAILPGATWSNSWAGVDLPEDRLMQASDIAILIKAALDVSPSATIEEIIIRPQLGDL